VSNDIVVIRRFIVILTAAFAMSSQISFDNILTDAKNTIDGRPRDVPAVSVLLLRWNGGWWVYATVADGGGTDTNHRSLAADCYGAVFDAARRLQRTIIGENRARSFFRAGWLMALFARSGRAGADGRTVARARIIQIARARADSGEGVRGVMRVKPLVRRNPAAAAHNHTAHYVRRPLRDATARTTRAHRPYFD